MSHRIIRRKPTRRHKHLENPEKMSHSRCAPPPLPMSKTVAEKVEDIWQVARALMPSRALPQHAAGRRAQGGDSAPPPVIARPVVGADVRDDGVTPRPTAPSVAASCGGVIPLATTPEAAPTPRLCFFTATSAAATAAAVGHGVGTSARRGAVAAAGAPRRHGGGAGAVARLSGVSGSTVAPPRPPCMWVALAATPAGQAERLYGPYDCRVAWAAAGRGCGGWTRGPPAAWR